MIRSGVSKVEIRDMPREERITRFGNRKVAEPASLDRKRGARGGVQVRERRDVAVYSPVRMQRLRAVFD
jgi:hypothetical protein